MGSNFWGRTLEEGVNGKLGSLTPQPMLQHMSAIQFSYEPASLPTRFDARQEWPGLISPIEDQGWCSSSWALATAAVAGDRLSVGKARRVDLSSQSLLSCDTAPQGGCRGGHVDRAWDSSDIMGPGHLGACLTVQQLVMWKSALQGLLALGRRCKC